MSLSIFAVITSFFVSSVATYMVSSFDGLEQELYFRAVTYSLVVSATLFPSLEHTLVTGDNSEISELKASIYPLLLLIQLLLALWLFFYDLNIVLLTALCAISAVSTMFCLFSKEYVRSIAANLLSIILFFIVFIYDKTNYSIELHIFIFFIFRSMCIAVLRGSKISLSPFKRLLEIRKAQYTVSNMVNAGIGVIFINILYLNTPLNIANGYALAQRLIGGVVGLYSSWVFPRAVKIVRSDSGRTGKMYISTVAFSLLFVLISLLVLSL